MSDFKMNENLKLIQITPGAIFFTEFASFTGEIVDEEGWLYKIGVPNPSSIKWEGSVITNEEKNAKGDMFLEFVNKKRKMTINWEFLTQVQYRNLFGHLGIDFNNSEQAILYYKIKALNPNSANYYTDKDGILQPRLEEMISYLGGSYVGNVKVYNSTQSVVADDDPKAPQNVELPMMIGYQDISLVFLER